MTQDSEHSVGAVSGDAAAQQPPPFKVMLDGYFAEARLESTLEDICGVDLMGIGWDWYDSSFEIYPDSEVEDLVLTDEQKAAVMALGCMCFWVNFPDGTERYCNGLRKPASYNRWLTKDRIGDRVSALHRFLQPPEASQATASRRPLTNAELESIFYAVDPCAVRFPPGWLVTARAIERAVAAVCELECSAVRQAAATTDEQAGPNVQKGNSK